MSRCRMGHSVLTVLLLTLAQSSMAVTLEIVPSTNTVTPGEAVTIDVILSGLGDFAAPALGAYNLDLHYDPAVFAFTEVVVGPSLGDAAAEATTLVTPGDADVRVFELSLLTDPELVALQPDSLLLFQATFEAFERGSGTFDATVNAPLADEFGAPLALDSVTPTTVTIVSVVDIPALSPWGLLLLFTAVATAALRLIRRSSK